MVFSLASPKRRQKLTEQARHSRESALRRYAAWVLVIGYNIVGVADIISTVIALDSGAGVEANPFVQTLMTHAGDGWIFAKLGLRDQLYGLMVSALDRAGVLYPGDRWQRLGRLQ